jgi:hypothetical protein
MSNAQGKKRKWHIKIWYENLKERDHSQDFGVNWNIILKYILKKFDGKILTKFMWHRIGTSGGLS